LLSSFCSVSLSPADTAPILKPSPESPLVIPPTAVCSRILLIPPSFHLLASSNNPAYAGVPFSASAFFNASWYFFKDKSPIS